MNTTSACAARGRAGASAGSAAPRGFAAGSEGTQSPSLE